MYSIEEEEQIFVPTEIILLIFEYLPDDFLLTDLQNTSLIFEILIKLKKKRKIIFCEFSDSTIFKLTTNYEDISDISIIGDFVDSSETHLTHRGLYQLLETKNLNRLEFRNISFGFESVNCLSYKSLKELSLIDCKIDFDDPVFDQGDEIELFETLEILVSPNAEIVKYFKKLRKLTVYTSDRMAPDLSHLKNLEEFTIIGFQGNSTLNFRFLLSLIHQLNNLTFINCAVPLRIANFVSAAFSLKELNFVGGTKIVGEKNYDGLDQFYKPNELFDLIDEKSSIEILRFHGISFMTESTLSNMAICFPKLKFISLINQNIKAISNLKFCENVVVKDINSTNSFLSSFSGSHNEPQKKLKKSFIFCKHCKILVNKKQYIKHIKNHWNEDNHYYCPNLECKFEGKTFSDVSKHLINCQHYRIICHGCKEEIEYSNYKNHICKGNNSCFQIKKVKLSKFYKEKNGKMIEGIYKLLDVENDTILRWRRRY